VYVSISFNYYMKYHLGSPRQVLKKKNEREREGVINIGLLSITSAAQNKIYLFLDATRVRVSSHHFISAQCAMRFQPAADQSLVLSFVGFTVHALIYLFSLV
jgi:hypothetical protein